MLRAIETGYVQNEIQDAAFEYQRAVETQDAIVVGVNKFAIGDEKPIPILKVNEEIERAQVERLHAIRANRDSAASEKALGKIVDAASGTENLIPHILTAVESHITVGEISHALRNVWGEYRESITI